MLNELCPRIGPTFNIQYLPAVLGSNTVVAIAQILYEELLVAPTMAGMLPESCPSGIGSTFNIKALPGVLGYEPIVAIAQIFFEELLVVPTMAEVLHDPRPRGIGPTFNIEAQPTVPGSDYVKSARSSRNIESVVAAGAAVAINNEDDGLPDVKRKGNRGLERTSGIVVAS
jgi:hypothetical protein